MAQPLNDNALQDLERHRLLLETQITQLRKALQTWQLWSAEYEGLKEEIEALSSPTNADLLAIGQNFNGQVVTLVEIDDILNLKGEQRNAAQIINLLDRRIDYVAQNVKTAEKQLHAAEDKLEKVGMVSEKLEDSARDEEGLPLTEIIEELDDEGNVISYKTNTPGSEKQQLLDVLRQVGVTEEEIQVRGLDPVDASEVEEDDTTKVLPATSEPSPKEPTDAVTEDAAPTRPSIQPRKKSVTFTEDTKPGPSSEPSKTEVRIAEIMSLSKAQNEPLPSTGPDAPIVPTSETEEEAALRREMLQYSMSEIGAVVAELDLESGSEWSEDDEGYDDEFSDGDDDEDAFGRSTRKVVDDDLHQRMRELEEKLGVRMMQNLGPKPPSDVSTERSEPDAGIAQIRITQEDVDRAAKLQSPDKPAEEEVKAAKKGKKGVRFADDVDVSPAPETKPAVKPTTPKPVPAPITDVVERQPAAVAAPAPPTAKKVSRFKSSRQANPAQGFIPPQLPVQSSRSERTVPTGPENATLATQVVEREIVEGGRVTEPDELDPGLLHQEVSTEFHRLRNRMIQREGGFKKKEQEVDDEGTILEYADEYDDEGRPKKVSRFMAARLGRQ
jgi:unconventional prefoldin RPB5 interactor 1